MTAERRRALLALQRATPGLRGVPLHFVVSGELRIASGRGISAALISRFSGIPVSPADARLDPEELGAWLSAVNQLDRRNLPGAARAALDRIAA